MSFRIEGPGPGTGDLEGMEVWKAYPVLPKGGAADLIRNFDRYKELVDMKYELSERKDRAILRPWLWGRIPRLNMRMTILARKIKEARAKLPL